MSEATPPLHDIPKIFQSSSAKPNRLIHLLPEELAKHVPDHALFSYPLTANLQDGFVDVSSRDFANAINRASWYLKSLLGLPKNFDTIAYMGPSKWNYLNWPKIAILKASRRYPLLHIHVCCYQSWLQGTPLGG